MFGAPYKLIIILESIVLKQYKLYYLVKTNLSLDPIITNLSIYAIHVNLYKTLKYNSNRALKNYINPNRERGKKKSTIRKLEKLLTLEFLEIFDSNDSKRLTQLIKLLNFHI